MKKMGEGEEEKDKVGLVAQEHKMAQRVYEKKYW